ncbi:MAG: Cysteine desulfurase [Parcubacteria group bacterium GW2011_GWA2_49_16]|nr:MAG: Cysteine desulfurase [Parcubacteria group bacterium GW2011_GWA2_49_16]
MRGYDEQMKRIYLDHASATPVDSGVSRVVAEALRKYTGNPSALHAEGKAARVALEGARTKIATVLAAHFDEIVFTSGATEANNMAISGVVQAARARGIERPHVVVSAIEHPSVLECVRAMEAEGTRVDYLVVDARGLIDTKELRKLITPETVLVSIMYANNEIGAIEPVREIAKEIRHARKVNQSAYPYFHTDAAQAGNYLDVNVLRLGVDMMTLSSGKTYGPRGIGALFIKRGVHMAPIMHGGEHERGRRPGTEPVAIAVGFAEVFAHAEKIKAKESARVAKLRDMLAEKILKKILGTSVNGDLANSLPNILNISFEGVESETLVLYLDAAGIAVSGKSACKSSSEEPSHVILAIGRVREERAGLPAVTSAQAGAVRFSLGRGTKREDIAYVAKELARIIPFLREARAQSDVT